MKMKLSDFGHILFSKYWQTSASKTCRSFYLEHFTINNLNSQVRRAKDGRHIKINDSTFSEASESSGYLDLSAEK